MGGVEVGMFSPFGMSTGTADALAALSRAVDEGVDHVCGGDHVSFFVAPGRTA